MTRFQLLALPDGCALLRPDGTLVIEAHGRDARTVCLRAAAAEGVLVLL